MRRFVVSLTLCLPLVEAFVAPSRLTAVHHDIPPTRTWMTPTDDVLPAITGTSLQLAETEPWVLPLSIFLTVFLNFMSLAMLCRVVLSWYPKADVREFPWAAVVFPTEPLLRAVKGLIPPAFGVDITPVAWLALFTFVNEILLGQQGLLTLKIKYGI